MGSTSTTRTDDTSTFPRETSEDKRRVATGVHEIILNPSGVEDNPGATAETTTTWQSIDTRTERHEEMMKWPDDDQVAIAS